MSPRYIWIVNPKFFLVVGTYQISQVFVTLADSIANILSRFLEFLFGLNYNIVLRTPPPDGLKYEFN